MSLTKLFLIAGIGAVFASGYGLGKLSSDTVAAAASAERVFEIRTYTTNEGKLEALNKRFRNHTTKLFERHGMTNVFANLPADLAGFVSQGPTLLAPGHCRRLVGLIKWMDVPFTMPLIPVFTRIQVL